MVAHGIQFEDVRLPGELAPIPAWYVPGERDTCLIFVHGKSSWRGEALRLMPVGRSLGLPMLAITYRGCEDVPADPAGRYTYGVTEWRDLEAAVRFAHERGARRVVLAGFSMGGSIVMSFLLRSELRDLVAGVILDSPMLDLRGAVEHQAALAGLGPQRRRILLTAARLVGVDWESFDYLGRANEFKVPILLFHGDDDRDVPIQVSDAFARRLPDLVEYVRMPGVGHLLAWNADPAAYESRSKVFLERLLEQACALTRVVPHDRPRFLVARDLLEARRTKRRHEPVEPVARADPFALRVNRVALDNSRAVRDRVFDGRLQKHLRQPARPVFPVGEEAHDSPCWLVVDRFHSPRRLYARVLVARRDRTPPGRLAIDVCEQPRHTSRCDDPLERPPVRFAVIRLVLPVRLAPPHAPATPGCAALAEHRFEVGPAVRCERMDPDPG